MRQKLKDVMTVGLATLEEDRPVSEAARVMRDKDIGDVLVTREGRLRGILTDRDVVVRCLADGGDPGRTTVGEVCSKELATLSPDDDADHAVALMAKKAVRRVPVVEDGRPLGVVSLGDLAQDRDRESALGSLSAARPNA